VSASRTFAGKIAIRDEESGRHVAFQAAGGSGTELLMYTTGDAGVDMRGCVLQLIEAGAACTQDLPYLIPGGGEADFLGLVGAAGVQDAWPFAYLPGNPILLASQSAAIAFAGALDLWDLGEGMRRFGWPARPSPMPAPWKIIVLAPARWFILDLLGGRLTSADFAWVDLSGEDYSQLNLRSCRWAYADLTGTKLVESTVAQADFTAAILRNADFTGAQLQQTSFRGAATVAGAIFRNAQLQYAVLDGLDLRSVDFRGANLDDAHLAGCDCRGIDFTVCASMKNVDLQGAQR